MQGYEWLHNILSLFFSPSASGRYPTNALQSDWFRERAVFSDFAHGQRNPGVTSLLCFKDAKGLSIKPINAKKIGEVPIYTKSYQWI